MPIKEATGGVFTRTIHLPQPLRGSEILDEVLGLGGHSVKVYRDGERVIMGRRKGYGLGGDIILVHSAKPSEDSLIWDLNGYYDTVVVHDGVWNDGFTAVPRTRITGHPNDTTIAACQGYTESLRARLKEIRPVGVS